jgi:protein phosphatase methylesterase 1
MFLACRAARLLILAGTDRLDKELMIGQMQGKFQMEVVPEVGHMLHEVTKWPLLRYERRN